MEPPSLSLTSRSDLIKLRQVMEGLENFFNGADGYMDDLCSASDEMEYY